jgi:phage repressor protein C with HTH and peptisase S24 domain
MEAIMGTPVKTVNRFSGYLPRNNIGMSIGERIKQARKAAKMSQEVLAKRTGLSQSTLSDLETGKSAGTTYVATLAASLGVSALWLETGKGQMAPGAFERLPLLGVLAEEFKRVHAADQDDPTMTQIRRVKIKVQAGITGFQVEPEHYDGETQGVPTKWMLKEGLSKDALVSTTVRGESMEPALYDGDVIVVNTRDTQLVSGAVYVINYEGEAVVKRMLRDAGQWWLTSDNSDQRKYHRQLCKGAECIVIGRVVRKESTHI